MEACLTTFLKMLEQNINRNYTPETVEKIVNLFKSLTNLSRQTQNAQTMGDNGMVHVILQVMFAVRDGIDEKEDLDIKINGAKLLTCLAINNGILDFKFTHINR